MTRLIAVGALCLSSLAWAGWKVGDQVIVEQEGTLYEAKIVSAEKGSFKVSYVGYDEQETVTPERIKLAVKAGGPWKANDKVMIEQGHKIYSGKIVSAEAGGKFKVSYDGYGSGDDETVAADRIRAPAPKGGVKTGGGAAAAPASDAPCPGPGQTRRCNGVCVDLGNDDNNCGACGSKCHDGYHCDGHLFCRDANGNI